jgi:hypothetical protein
MEHETGSYLLWGVGSGTPNDREDVVTVKQLLKRIRRLPGEASRNPVSFDAATESTVIAYQKERNLKPDGFIAPRGPTERTIRRDIDTIRRNAPTRSRPFSLTQPLGTDRAGTKEETRRVTSALSDLGLIDDVPDKDRDKRGPSVLNAAIRKFQLGNNLSPSGMMEPGDETEDALKRTMSADDAGAAQSQPTAGTGSAAAEGGEQGRPGGTPDNNDTQAPQPEADGTSKREAEEFLRSRRPLGRNGKPLPAHPDDIRFNKDGTLSDAALHDDPKINKILEWGLENTGINPETGKLDYYGNIAGFERDPESGRWKLKSPRQADPAPEQPATPKKNMPSEIKLPPTPPIGNKKGGSKSGRRRYAADFAAWLLDLYGDRIRDSLK